MKDYIFAIDPGNVESAYCVIDSRTLEPRTFDKCPNEDLVCTIRSTWIPNHDFVIERIASYGMAVGQTVFETAEWYGDFRRTILDQGGEVTGLYRRDVKLHICGSSRAKDSNIRIALIDRFAKHDKKRGKGTKDNPDWFHGFHSDCWSAYAVGLTYIETLAYNLNDN